MVKYLLTMLDFLHLHYSGSGLYEFAVSCQHDTNKSWLNFFMNIIYTDCNYSNQMFLYAQIALDVVEYKMCNNQYFKLLRDIMTW